MKITCSTQLLNEACQNIQRVVTTKTTIPAAEGIFLQAEDGKLKLTGYDMEVGIKTTLDIKVEEVGSIVLNAKILCDILRKLPAETVQIEADERQLCVIRSGETEYKLVGIAAEDYPELPTVMETNPILMDSSLLENMVRQTIFSVSTNENKIVHTGVKFEVSHNLLSLVAVDGFRLALRTEEIKYEGKDCSFVVPAKTLTEVVKLLAGSEVVQLNVAERHIIFSVGSYSVISRLLDGDFLDYHAAIPKNHSTLVTINVRAFIDSIERTSLIITDRFKSPLRCVFDENTIKVSTTTSLGSANDRIPAKIDGERVEIGFNNRFLLDALRACNLEEAVITLNGPLSPITIVPPEGNKFLFLVLPVRLRNE